MGELIVDLNGRTALVTGGGRGIGQAIARALARCGAEVAVNYRTDAEAAQETVKSISAAGGRAWAVAADVSRGAEVRRLFDEVQQRFGNQLDILINNAGGVERCHLQVLSEEAWDQTLAVNLKSVFLCTQAALPILRDTTGRIINISSISARSGGAPDMAHYAAAKAGVSNFTRVCARIAAPRGITINALAPGVIWTDFHKDHTPAAELTELKTRIPLQRLGDPADCAAATLLLCSSQGAYITGEIVEINGGLLMN